MSKVLCCFKLPLSGQVTTGKVGAAKVDRRAAARTGTGRQRSLRRASGHPRAVSPRRWGAQVPFHSQLPRVPPHTEPSRRPGLFSEAAAWRLHSEQEHKWPVPPRPRGGEEGAVA